MIQLFVFYLYILVVNNLRINIVMFILLVLMYYFKNRSRSIVEFVFIVIDNCKIGK